MKLIENETKARARTHRDGRLNSNEQSRDEKNEKKNKWEKQVKTEERREKKQKTPTESKIKFS